MNLGVRELQRAGRQAPAGPGPSPCGGPTSGKQPHARGLLPLPKAVASTQSQLARRALAPSSLGSRGNQAHRRTLGT